MVTLFQIFIDLVILVSLGQLYLMARYVVWPRLYHILHCPWCWQQCALMHQYPPCWTSTLCTYHDEAIRRQAAARQSIRRQQLQALTHPASDREVQP